MKGAGREYPLAYIGMGSNLGDRGEYLSSALEAMEGEPGIRLLEISRASSTAPVDNVEQPDFLNQVASIETRLAPRELLSTLQGIEKRFGRERSTWKGPRTIDLDILLYDDLVLDEPGLRVPHGELLNRPFFVRMVLEIDPDVIEPVSRRPLSSFLDPSGNEQTRPDWRVPHGEQGE